MIDTPPLMVVSSAGRSGIILAQGAPPRRRQRVPPRLLAVDEEAVREHALVARLGRRDFDDADFGVAFGNVSVFEADGLAME